METYCYSYLYAEIWTDSLAQQLGRRWTWPGVWFAAGNNTDHPYIYVQVIYEPLHSAFV